MMIQKKPTLLVLALSLLVGTAIIVGVTLVTLKNKNDGNIRSNSNNLNFAEDNVDGVNVVVVDDSTNSDATDESDEANGDNDITDFSSSLSSSEDSFYGTSQSSFVELTCDEPVECEVTCGRGGSHGGYGGRDLHSYGGRYGGNRSYGGRYPGSKMGIFVCRDIVDRFTGGVVGQHPVCVRSERTYETDTCGCCGRDCPTPCECPCTLPDRVRNDGTVVPPKEDGVKVYVDGSEDWTCVPMSTSRILSSNPDSEVTCVEVCTDDEI